MPEGKTVLLEGTPFQELSGSDCTWGLEDDKKSPTGRHLVVSLEKREKLRWIVLLR